MKKVLLAIVLVVLLFCSFVSQVNVVVPEMSEPENGESNETRGDRLPPIGGSNVTTCLSSFQEGTDERLVSVSGNFHKDSSDSSVSLIAESKRIAKYELDTKSTHIHMGRDVRDSFSDFSPSVGGKPPAVVVSNKSDFETLQEGHAIIHSLDYANDIYEGGSCYLSVTVYNDDAGVWGADLYLIYTFYDKNGDNRGSIEAPKHYVEKGDYHTFPLLEIPLADPNDPKLPPGHNTIIIDLWWDDFGWHRWQYQVAPTVDVVAVTPDWYENGYTDPSVVYDNLFTDITCYAKVDDYSGLIERGFSYKFTTTSWSSWTTWTDYVSGGTHWFSHDVPRSTWISHVGEKLSFRWYAIDYWGLYAAIDFVEWTEIRDDDTSGPSIDNVQVSEYNGDGDGIIRDDEQVKISWTLSDPSGIYSTSCTVDENSYPVQDSYYIICGPFGAGNYAYEISAKDNDYDNNDPNDRASNTHLGSFTLYRKRELGVIHKVQRKDTYMLCLGWGSNGEPFDGQFAWDRPHPTDLPHETGSLLDDKYCARASVSMIVSYYGGTLSQDRISYYYFEEWSGSPHRDGKPEGDLGCGSGMWGEDVLSWALNGATLTHHNGKPSFSNQIELWIDQNRPIYIHYVWYDGGVENRHAMVIDGYDTYGEKVHVLDPWNIAGSEWDKVWISYNDFESIYGSIEKAVVPQSGATGRSDEATIWMDSDGDGVYDFDEIYRFGTNRYSSDTDGDGVNDKEEIVSYTFLSDHSYDASNLRKPDPDSDNDRCELDDDSDDGGVQDGLEDKNGNGFFEPALGETDPLDSSDDPNAVHLESSQDNAASSNLGTIKFDGSTYSLPSDITKPAGTYPIEYNADPGYEFDHWETTPGITVTNPNAWSTTATVTGSGTLRAIYKLSQAPYLYVWPSEKKFETDIECEFNNTEFTVEVVVNNVTDCYGVDFWMTYNSTLLSKLGLVDVHGPFDSGNPPIRPDPVTYPGGYVLTDISIPGTVRVSFTFVGALGAPSFNGTGTVCSIKFKIIYCPPQIVGEPPQNNTVSCDLAFDETKVKIWSPYGTAQPRNPSVNGYYEYTTIAGTHAIRITSVTTSKTIVGQGYNITINVTIINHGIYDETFNATAYYNDTAIILPNGKNYTTVTLTIGNSTTVTFEWNTTGVPYGNYTISAYAHPVPGETYTTDNTYIDGWVLISVVGDVNGDGTVDGGDQIAVGNSLWTTPEDPPYPPPPVPCYNPNADVNGDGEIDGGDQIIVGNHLWESWP